MTKFGTIKIIREGKEQLVNLDEVLKINRLSIDEELSEQSALYAFWNAVLSHAEALKEKLKLQLETHIAELDSKFRKQNPDQNPTKRRLEENNLLTKSYQDLRFKLIDMREKRDRLKGFVKALEQRSVMLATEGKRLQKEFDSDIYIRKD